MTFSLGGFINGFTGSKRVNKVLLSPIWMAVVITLILTIIAYFILRSYIDDGLYSMLAKQAIYMILATIAMVFLHDQAMIQKFERDNVDRRKEEIISSSIPELTELRSLAKPDIQTEQTPVIGSGIVQNPTPEPRLEVESLTISSDGTVGDEYFT